MKNHFRILSILLCIGFFLTVCSPASAYARTARDQEDVPTRDTMPSTGWAGCMIIPVQFADEVFQDDAETMLTEIFIGDGLNIPPSVLTYFQRSSYGTFYTDAVIQFPVTLSGNRAEYDYDPSRVIDEALNVIGNRGVTVPTFDENGDGIIDSLFLVFAGSSKEETIWTTHTDSMSEGLYSNGVYISNYSFICYEDFFDGTPEGEYSAIREMMHQLGLSDLYTLEEGEPPLAFLQSGMGDLDPYSKALLGWNHFREISDSGEYELTSSSITNDGLRLHIPGQEDVYLVEYVTREANQKPIEAAEEGFVRIWKVQEGMLSQAGTVLKQGNTARLTDISQAEILVTFTEQAQEAIKLTITYQVLEPGENENSEASQAQEEAEQSSVPANQEESNTNTENSAQQPEQQSSSTSDSEELLIPDENHVAFNGNVKPKKITAPVGISMVILFGACAFLLHSGKNNNNNNTKRRRRP